MSMSVFIGVYIASSRVKCSVALTTWYEMTRKGKEIGKAIHRPASILTSTFNNHTNHVNCE